MPAKVIIQSGISAGTSHWIEKAVIRAGSDPKSDVCLPSADVPTHALTIEFRDQTYRVYNRCRYSIFVGASALEPGKAAAWPDGELLQLSKDIQLVLDVDDDPTPMPMADVVEPAYDVDEEEVAYSGLDAGPSKNARPGDGSKTMLQVAVIAFCLLGCVGLLARESLKGRSSDRSDPPSFATTVRDAIKSQTSPELLQRLQYAESAAIRGNKKSARSRFGELRDDLVPQKESFASANRKSELAILDFVEYRLGQLE